MKAPKAMNMTERRELRKLVEQRFELLSERLRTTETHVRCAIEERIESEASDKVEAAERATEALMQRAVDAEKALADELAQIQKDYMELVREQRKLGIEPDETFGLVKHRRRGHQYSRDLESSEELGDIVWSVRDVDKLVEREYAKVRATKGDVQASLLERKNDMLTDIIMGVFQSDEARAMLDTIPTLDNFIRLDKVDDIIELEG